MTGKKAQRETNPDVLKKAMVRRVPRRSSGSGQIVWPAVPSLLEHYVQCLSNVFAALGRTFSAQELERIRDIMKPRLATAHAASPFSKIVIDYKTQDPPSTALDYTVSHRVVTIADEYAEWVRVRTPPLFGAHPDAKVLHLAASLGSPAEVAVLDVGAGTGRNTLPLARAGYPTDAVELAPVLAEILRKDVKEANLEIRVFEGNALDPALEVPAERYRLVVCAEVVASHFRNVAEIRSLFERVQTWLSPGGIFLFSMFIAGSGYKPVPLAREMSETMWCCLFTRPELEEAVRDLPFTMVSDESAHDFEQEHLDKSQWPPTGWYPDWARGLDLWDIPADKSPMELRWLAFRRNA